MSSPPRQVFPQCLYHVLVKVRRENPSSIVQVSRELGKLGGRFEQGLFDARLVRRVTCIGDHDLRLGKHIRAR